MTDARTLPELDQAILNALAEGPMMTPDIARALREDGPRVHRRLTAMLEDKIVQRRGGGRSGGGDSKGITWRIRPVAR